ncbi:MAG TPA: hypothetical protein VHG29_06345 [Novosphingobium sp.]|nr:hypothetical protein [Novosphingobium sp.]
MITATQNPFSRTLFAAGLAIAGTIATFGATTTTAHAATNGYSVSLATPLEAPRQEIINGVLWRCDGASCTAASDGSSPANACTRVVKKFGPVASFAIGGRELAADKLQRCNAG